MKKNYIFLLFSVLFLGLNAQILSEDFDDVDSLFNRINNPWKAINFSNPVGAFGWSNSGGAVFSGIGAYNGDSTQCLLSSYSAVSGCCLLSNFAITPPISLKNGDTVSFYTRVPTNSTGGVTYPDRLIVRINTVDAGADSLADMGDGIDYLDKYDSVLVDINPTWSKLPYPTGYPRVWTKITAVINKFTGSNARLSRIAFQNRNDSGGVSGAWSNLIGIDALRITSGGSGSNIADVKAADKFSVYPNPANNFVFIKASDNNAITASVLALDGKVLKTEVLGTDGKMNIENLAPGFYNLKIENGNEVIYKKISKK
jgi:Secretion system C-terminal sorting domain